MIPIVATTRMSPTIDADSLGQAIIDTLNQSELAHDAVPIDVARGYTPTKEWWATLEAILWTRLAEHWGRVAVSRPLGPVAQMWTDAEGVMHVRHEPWEQRSIVVHARGQSAAIDADMIRKSVNVRELQNESAAPR